MDADYSIELGPDDPVLDFPWTDPTGEFAYIDLKKYPELLAKVEEAQRYPELAALLRMVNSTHSAFESAKCDCWATTELNAEEEIFEASHKFGCYVDLVVSSFKLRASFPFHEKFVKSLTELLRRAPEIGAAVEVCVRRCFYGEVARTREGFYFTAYISGYGDDGSAARKNWGIGLKLVESAIMQFSANGKTSSGITSS
jgi:hypothetical protein